MAAYAMVELTINEPAGMAEYREKVGATVAAHGGRYLVRGEPVEVLEGGVGEHPIKVILEFPDLAAARAWYNSAEYQAIIGGRLASSQSNFILIDGV